MCKLHLNFKKKGVGKPLIILHGLFGMLDNWNTLGNEFANLYTVYLVDQRNHGKSPKSKEFNYNLLAEDLYNFCKSQEINDVIIIGHSMGGKTAMNFARLYPDLVSSLIVVDIAPRDYKQGHNEIFKAILSVPIKEVQSRKEVDVHLTEYITDLGIRQFLMKNLKRKKEGGYEWKANFKELYIEYENILAKIPIENEISSPSLFIKGGLSSYISEQDIEHIEAQFENAEIVTIPDAGHWVHAEKPKELLSVVFSFLENKLRNTMFKFYVDSL